MTILRVKNWAEFQHYKDRDPTWIKLHKKLLDNRDFHKLSPLAGKMLPLIWLLASENEGVVPTVEELAFRLRISDDECKRIADELEAASFLVGEAVADDAPQPSLSKQIAEVNGFSSRHIPDKVKRAVWERDGGKCVQCKAVDLIEYDHKIPVSRGGPSDDSNIQLLCRKCNRRKRTKVTEPAEMVATPAQAHVSDSRSLETETDRENTSTDTDRGRVVREPEVLEPKDPRVEIIEAFDGERVKAFGAPLGRAFPHGTDIVHAKRMIEAGATLEICRSVFRDGFGRAKQQGRDPPDTLKYFEKPVANAIAEQNQPHAIGAASARTKPGPATGFAAAFAAVTDERPPDWGADSNFAQPLLEHQRGSGA